MMPALLGGLFIGILSGLPIIGICNCCCLWIVSGGILAAYLEQQNQPLSLTLTQGARVGLIAGIIGAVIWLVIDSALSPIQARFVGDFMRSARDLPPELYPEHDVFIQLMKLKNTLRHMRGEELITHLGREYYD